MLKFPHLLWMGLFESSDQLAAMKHFRKSLNESLSRIKYELQDQAYNHVLRPEEKQEQAFRDVCEYIFRNPERVEVVEPDCYKQDPFTGCLIPGYPQLRPFEAGYWAEFDKVVSYIRSNGLFRNAKA